MPVFHPTVSGLHKFISSGEVGVHILCFEILHKSLEKVPCLKKAWQNCGKIVFLLLLLRFRMSNIFEIHYWIADCVVVERHGYLSLRLLTQMCNTVHKNSLLKLIVLENCTYCKKYCPYSTNFHTKNLELNVCPAVNYQTLFNGRVLKINLSQKIVFEQSNSLLLCFFYHYF